MQSIFLGRALLAALVILFSGTACAEQSESGGTTQWVLDADTSSLNFVSVKAAQVVEVHKFGSLSGGVAVAALEGGSEGGEVDISIDLASVNTNVAIRDERMREHLFETAKFPVARVTGAVPVGEFLALPAGDSIRASVKLVLELHGVSVPVIADTLVSRLSASRLVIASTQPIVVNAAGFNLAAGVEKLRELAGLPSIAGAAPVSFVLTLVRSNEAE